MSFRSSPEKREKTAIEYGKMLGVYCCEGLTQAAWTKVGEYSQSQYQIQILFSISGEVTLGGVLDKHSAIVDQVVSVSKVNSNSATSLETDLPSNNQDNHRISYAAVMLTYISDNKWKVELGLDLNPIPETKSEGVQEILSKLTWLKEPQGEFRKNKYNKTTGEKIRDEKYHVVKYNLRNSFNNRK